MSPDIINVGASPNDGQGDPIRTAFIKTNANFSTLFALPNDTPPTTLVGSAGDVPGMYAYNSSYFYYCFASWNGNSTIWAQVAQINSVSVNKINNGNSNVSIAGANANVTVTVNSVANLATFSTAGLSVNGNITGNYFIGNGSQLTGIISSYSNANVANFIPTYSGNIGSLLSIGNVSTISFFVGDGSQLSNIAAANVIGAYSNANVANYLPTFSGNIAAGNIGLSGNVNAVGDITGLANIVASPGGYFQGDGSQLTGIVPGNYSNANVADYLPTYSGNITAATISTTGNITTAGFFLGTFVGNISGNLVVPGANTQVLYNNNGNAGASPGLTFDSASNVLASTGNISTNGNIISLSVYTSSVVSATGNVRGGNLNTTGIVSATGNVYGNYFVGITANAVFANIANIAYSVSGANVSGVVANATYANTSNTANTANSASLVLGPSQTNITSLGILTSLSVSGNISANAVTANTITANSVVTSTGTFRLPSYTTSQIANIAAVGGDIVYNSTLQLVQAYQLNPATSSMGWVSWTVAVYQ